MTASPEHITLTRVEAERLGLVDRADPHRGPVRIRADRLSKMPRKVYEVDHLNPESKCSTCGAKVFFAPTAAMHRGIYDWEPVPAGNYAPLPDGRMAYVKRQPGDETPRYISHWATCPRADEHRRVWPPKSPGEGVKLERPGPENVLSKLEGFS